MKTMFHRSHVSVMASLKQRFINFGIPSSFFVTCSFAMKEFSDCQMFTVKYLLSKENREKCINRLKSVKPFRVPTEGSSKEAAVLVPFCTVKGELSLLYTVRSVDLKRHSGQVSFPGGMKDDNDDSLESTAIRETEEELGITKGSIDIIGSGNLLATRSRDTTVLPVLGFLNEIDITKLNVNTDEVETVFTISLKDLCNPKYFSYTQFRNSYCLPAYSVGEHRIWGLTAMITHIVLSALAPEIYKHKLKYVLLKKPT